MTRTRILQIAGFVIHTLIGLLLIFSGLSKLLGTIPKEVLDGLTAMNMADDLRMIAWGEMITGVLLIVPQTMSLGTLLTSGFWGGTIVFHMARGEGYAMHSAFLIATWIGAQLRNGLTLSSLLGWPATLRKKVETPANSSPTPVV